MPNGNNKFVSHFDGDIFGEQVETLTNLTGAAVADGDVVAMNHDFAYAGDLNIVPDQINPTDTNNNPNPRFLFGNVVPLTIQNQYGPLWVARGPTARGARGKFQRLDNGLARLKTPACTRGQFVYANASNVAGVLTGTQAQLDLQALPVIILGKVLETDASAGIHLCMIDMSGRLYGGGG